MKQLKFLLQSLLQKLRLLPCVEIKFFLLAIILLLLAIILLLVFGIVFYAPIRNDNQASNNMNEVNNSSYGQPTGIDETDYSLLNTGFANTINPQELVEEENPKLAKDIVLVENPTFNDVAQAGCGYDNPYINKQVQWKAKISHYAHTSGIRLLVIDEDHPDGSDIKHGHFWGIFLVSPEKDPRYTEEGLKDWGEKWNTRWVDYILDVYGGIKISQIDEGTKFLVDATIDHIWCEKKDGDKILNDDGYIETTIKKIRIIK